MKYTKLLAVTMLILFLPTSLIGCASGTKAAELKGTYWTLYQLDGKDPLPGSQVTLIFADGQVRGIATCNRFSGSYEDDGKTLSFGPLMTTMMACDGLDQETAFLTALESISAYRIEGERLVLSSAADDAILVFAAMQHASLEDTTWELVGLNDGAAIISLVPDTRITATFSGQRVTGSAGCNGYGTSFTVDGDTLTMSGPVESTLMYCDQPEGIMEQEQAYLDALGSVATFQIEGNALTILNAAGERLLEFVATQDG